MNCGSSTVEPEKNRRVFGQKNHRKYHRAEQSQLVLKCKKRNVCLFLFLFLFMFRSPAGRRRRRLATRWTPRMRREKRLRGETFCGGPVRAERRSPSSRRRRSRGHFVQTNNTAVSPLLLLLPESWPYQEVAPRYVTPDQSERSTQTPPLPGSPSLLAGSPSSLLPGSPAPPSGRRGRAVDGLEVQVSPT